MNMPFAALLLAACSIVGCSSSPLSGTPESDAGSPAAGETSTSPTPEVDASGGGPGSTWAAYPAGPYGTTRGARIANLAFLGWRHPDLQAYDTNQFERVQLSDFYDPAGQGPVKLLAINASAVWCSVCRAEYSEMRSTKVYDTLRANGVEVLGSLFEDVAYYPAQPRDLHNWGIATTYDVKFPLVLDPGFKLGAYFDSDATPLNMLVDVRTMTIVSVEMGYSETYWADVQAAAAKL